VAEKGDFGSCFWGPLPLHPTRRFNLFLGPRRQGCKVSLTGISIFGKNHFTTIYTHTSTASNLIDMDPFLLQTVELSSNYDTVHFGGDLVREEDENMSDRIKRCNTRSTLPVVLLVFEPLLFRGVGYRQQPIHVS
jgi:hypothetical protein